MPSRGCRWRTSDSDPARFWSYLVDAVGPGPRRGRHGREAGGGRLERRRPRRRRRAGERAGRARRSAGGGGRRLPPDRRRRACTVAWSGSSTCARRGVTSCWPPASIPRSGSGRLRVREPDARDPGGRSSLRPRRGGRSAGPGRAPARPGARRGAVRSHRGVGAPGSCWPGSRSQRAADPRRFVGCVPGRRPARRRVPQRGAARRCRRGGAPPSPGDVGPGAAQRCAGGRRPRHDRRRGMVASHRRGQPAPRRRWTSTGTWFRYHHLLRDLLRLELQAAYPGTVAALHARAAAWFAIRAGPRPARSSHWLAAGEPVAAAGSCGSTARELLREGQIETLRGLLDRLGDEAKASTVCALALRVVRVHRRPVHPGAGMARHRVGGRARRLRPDATRHRCASTSHSGGVMSPRRSTPPASWPPPDSWSLTRADLATATGAAYAWAGAATRPARALQLAVEKATAGGVRTAHVLALVYLAIVEVEDGQTAAAREAAHVATSTAQHYGLAELPRHGARVRDPGTHGRGSRPGPRRRAARRRPGAAGVHPLALGYVLTTCGDTLLTSVTRPDARSWPRRGR